MDPNPQAEQMADESMVRILATQAACIWPQEEALFARYALASNAAILDVGSGSGEISSRLAERYPRASVTGLDILPGSVARARERWGTHGGRLRFEIGDAHALPFDDATFDLVVCRHVIHAVHGAQVLAELVRCCKPGGWVHVLAEDYEMLHFPCHEAEIDTLWTEGMVAFCAAIGTDARIGRRTWSLLHKLGLANLRVDYAHVDTLRCPRDTFAGILRAWRDGFAKVIQERGRMPPGTTAQMFERAIATVLDPQEYAVWNVPIISGKKATAMGA